jgi:formylglycine-generating enzyme required for sulfatase activity
MAQRFALLMGVSDYGEGFEPLPGSLLDVREMQRVLGNPEQGGFQIHQILENPDRAQAETAIEAFFEGRSPDDLLLFYFSGHGDLGSGGILHQQLHLCVKGSHKANQRLRESTALSATVLKRRMDLCKSQKIIIILDCCYSGAIADLLKKGAGDEIDYAEFKATGRVILASSSASKTSLQAKNGLSLYTGFLLEGMEGAVPTNSRQWITARDLHHHAEQRFEIAKGGSHPPKIIAADTSFDLPIAKAPKPDAESDYRDRVTALFQELDHELGLAFTGIIDDPLDRGSLETLRSRLQLSPDIAQTIEKTIQAPYLARAQQRQTYAQYWRQVAEKGYLPTPSQQKRLGEIRQNIGLSSEDAAQIEQALTQEFNLQRPPLPPPISPLIGSGSQSFLLELLDHLSIFDSQTLRRQALRYIGYTFLGMFGLSILTSRRDFPGSSENKPLRSPSAPVPSDSPSPTSDDSKAPSVSSSAALKLDKLSFETVTVDQTGKVKQREPKSAQAFTEDLGNGISLVMVQIPAGSFQMGSPTSEAGRDNREGPQRQVKLPTFFIGKFEVTQAQWAAVAKLEKVNIDLQPDPANFKGKDRPVEQISWWEAVEFCDRLSRKTGKAYRLPSEAEWEYACRAGTETPFHFGDTLSTAIANYNGNYTYGKGVKGEYRQQTTPVGSFPANAFGLHDMHGNVWEWCADHWHGTYDLAPTNGSAWIEGGNSDLRLLRGGSWNFSPANCRSALRRTVYPAGRDDSVGFRVVSGGS